MVETIIMASAKLVAMMASTKAVSPVTLDWFDVCCFPMMLVSPHAIQDSTKCPEVC